MFKGIATYMSQKMIDTCILKVNCEIVLFLNVQVKSSTIRHMKTRPLAKKIHIENG